MLPERKSLSLIDLQEIDDGNRYELIDGELYLLASPLPVHTLISDALHILLNQYFRKKKCRVFFAPADVYLFNQPGDPKKNIDTVVQPDMFVICDPKQVTEKGFFGPPSLVVEILSASSISTDKVTKFLLYRQAGVKEYWIVNPKNDTVTVHFLKNDSYVLGGAYTKEETLVSETFPELEIPVAEIFAGL